MSTTETIHLLEEAAHEITSLRRRNEVLEAQLHIVHVFELALSGTQPNRSQGYSIDIVPQLLKHAQAIVPKPAPDHE